MDLKILNVSNNALPEYKTKDSSGLDLRAYLPDGPLTLQPGQRRVIPTGLYMEIEPGYEGQVRPRSGRAVKQGLTVINSPGTIDADYRGEVGVPLINLSTEPQTIENGDRIAQIVFSAYEKAEITEVGAIEELSDTERGAGGFGHTGKK
jgi:dUTP pyrophosphatase